MAIVLFDIDGTLVQTGGAGHRAFSDTFRSLFGIEELSGSVKFSGRSDRAIANELMEFHQIEPSIDNWSRFVEAFVPSLLEQLPKCHGRVLPGVVELLDELGRHEQVLVGLLTGNIAAGAKAKLSHYQLWDHFAFGGYGDDWTSRNDIAAAALAAAQTQRTRNLAAIPSNTSEGGSETVIVIGDTPADVECARSIGAIAVAVLTGGANEEELSAAQPDVLLPDLNDPAAIMSPLSRELSIRQSGE